MEMPSVVVRLACGECSLLVNPQGTLLSKTFVSPILSVRALLALGYKVEWDSSRCRIWHPSRGVLDTDVSTGCPEISEQKALELIGEYEALVQRGESRCARLHCLMKDLAGLSNAELADVIVRRDVHSDAAVKKLVEKVFGDTPSDLREQAVASVQDPAGESFTWNRRMRRKFERAKGLVVHLFCGEGRKAFDRVSEKHGLIHVPVDTAEDLLAEGTYQYLLRQAVDSKKQQVVAGAISRMYARAISDGLSVQRIHTDRGKEYRNSALDAFCQKLGVHHTYAMAEEHQTNGRAEGAILKIKNRTREILEGSGQDDLSEWPLAAKLASYHLRSEARKKLRMPCEPTVVAAWSLEFENYHGCHKMSLFGNFEGVGGENGRGSLYEAGSWEPKDVASLAVAMSKHVANIVLPIVTSGGVTESRMLENGKRLWETGFTYLPGTKSEYWGFKTLASVSAVVLRRLEIAGRRPVNGRGGLLSLCISVTQTTEGVHKVYVKLGLRRDISPAPLWLIGDTGEASGLEILPPPRPKATVSEEFPEWCPAGVYIACLVAELRALYMKLQGDEADTCSGEAQKGHGEVDASVSGEAVGCSDFEWDDDSQDVKMYQVPDCIKPLRPCHSSDVGDSCYTLERVDWPMCVNVADEMQELAEVHRAMCSLLDGQSEEVDGQCCSCEAQWLDEVQGLEQVEAEACQLDRKSEECMLGSGSLKAVQMDDDDPPPLQSKIVAQDQVRRELGKWRGSMGEEVESLVQKTEAVEDLTDDQYHKLVADPGVHVELIPGKMVYVWKSTGRRRARMVGCGNFCDNDGSTQKADLFASGAGAESIRMMIRKCTLEPSWHLVSVDVKTAFLQAPLMEMQKDGKEKVTVVKVPSILREAGVTATKYWKVKKALYGLNSAPRSWSLHRDRVMTDLRIEYGDGILRLRKLKEDANLWQILKYPREGRDPEKEAGEAGGQCLGIIALYVDDILVASEKDVAQAVVRGLESNWELSTPDWVSEEGDCLKFAGFELEKTSQGIRLHQESYTKDILEQYQDTIPGVERTPAVKTVESEEPVDRSEQLEWTKRAQSLIGQLLWLAGRTRPDIAYAVNLAAQRIVPSPGEAVARAEHLIRSADILGLMQADSHSVPYC
ncbi:unnamed protein product [Symbiodinium sp. CCMP2592]|nr:unnamed protein product [Symbiodinium sp. CCMP2592]